MVKKIAKIIDEIAVATGFAEQVTASTAAEELPHASEIFPLAEHLLYRHVCGESGLFLHEGSMGFAFEVQQIVGANESIEKNLRLFVETELPADSYVQFLLIASHDISGVLDQWEQGMNVNQNKHLKDLTSRRRQFVQENALSFGQARRGILPRNFRSFVTVSVQGNDQEQIDACLHFQQMLEAKLMAENFAPRRVTGQDLIYIAREILQPAINDNRPFVPRFEEYNYLNGQIPKAFAKNTIRPDGIVHEFEAGSCISRIFAPVAVPEEFSFASMIKLLGDEERVIPGRFALSFCLANNLGSKGTSQILAAANRSMHAASKSYTRHDLVAQEEARQWMQVKAMHKKGEVFLQESMLIMLTTHIDEIEAATSVLKSLYNMYDFKIEAANYVQRLANLAMLPMMQGAYWRSLEFFKLTRIGLSGEVVAKLPIQGEWRGVNASGMLLVGRRGQLFNFNPFYRVGGGGNFNGVVMATSGAGKSFALQELVRAMSAQGVAAFILDIGGSYKNICRLLDGELVRFDSSQNLSLNPFANLSISGARFGKILELLERGVAAQEIAVQTGATLEEIKQLALGKSQDGANEFDGIEIIRILANDNRCEYLITKDSIIYAKAMLAAMCGVISKPRHEALLERAIIEAIKKYGSDLDLTLVAAVLAQLEDHDGRHISEAKAMADSLYPYSAGGIHGRFFRKSEKTATFNQDITVFELEELVNDKPLLSVVLQVILMQITMQFLCGDRSRKFIVIVDEAWMILDYAAKFLEGFARTVRKYGGSLWVCTQDLSSFNNDSGQKNSQAAILECATWKFIMKQNADGVKSFAANPSYAKYRGLIQSIKKCSDNRFSEILILSDGLSVVGRLAVDAYSTAVFSTENSDYHFLLEQEKQGVAKHEAISKLAQKYEAKNNRN
jgi:conjugal transfer ATP-binding protein TraC